MPALSRPRRACVVLIAATVLPSLAAARCERPAAGTVAYVVCFDARLSALDGQLAEVYQAATRSAYNTNPPLLAAGQRGWARGREACLAGPTPHECIEQATQRRIAELQARHRLVAQHGPLRFHCEGEGDIQATFFRSETPTMIVQRGDEASLLYLVPSGSGARYHGAGKTFWEWRGEATLVWGRDAPRRACVRKRTSTETP